MAWSSHHSCLVQRGWVAAAALTNADRRPTRRLDVMLVHYQGSTLCETRDHLAVGSLIQERVIISRQQGKSSDSQDGGSTGRYYSPAPTSGKVGRKGKLGSKIR